MNETASVAKWERVTWGQRTMGLVFGTFGLRWQEWDGVGVGER